MSLIEARLTVIKEHDKVKGTSKPVGAFVSEPSLIDNVLRELAETNKNKAVYYTASSSQAAIVRDPAKAKTVAESILEGNFDGTAGSTDVEIVR
ncbi:MAG: hypothetical protein ACLRFG_02015 [Clostridia bacterium]